MRSTGQYVELKSAYDDVARYIRQTDDAVDTFILGCDQLCNLAISTKQFDSIVCKISSLILKRRELLSRDQKKLQLRMSKEREKQYADMNLQYPFSLGHIHKWVKLYESIEHLPSIPRIDKFELQCKWNRDILYITKTRVILSDRMMVGSEVIEDVFRRYLLVRSALLEYAGKEATRKLYAKINKYNEWKREHGGEYKQLDTLRETNRVYRGKDDSVMILKSYEAVLSKMTTCLCRIAKLLRRIGECCVSATHSNEKGFYHELYTQNNATHECIASEIRDNNTAIKEREKKDLVDALCMTGEKCLLSRESRLVIEHDHRTECLFVFATNISVGYKSLAKVALLSKAGYDAVYRAMKTRLIQGGAIFHPVLIKKWTLQHIDVETLAMTGLNRNCSLNVNRIRVKEAENDFHYRDLPCMLKGEHHMTIHNRHALDSFGFLSRYLNYIYALQTCYHHVYTEFHGTGVGKMYGLVSVTDNTSSLYFKVDDTEPDYCYVLSFVMGRSITKIKE